MIFISFGQCRADALRAPFSHIAHVPNIIIYQFTLYSILKHWSGGYIFIFGIMLIEFSLGDVALVMGF